MRVFSALLHCRLIVFHWNQFQHSSRFKHFLRKFPSVLLRNIKQFFFEKNRMVNHFTPTPNNTMLQMEMKKYSYYQECSCVCNELPVTKPTKDKLRAPVSKTS